MVAEGSLVEFLVQLPVKILVEELIGESPVMILVLLQHLEKFVEEG